MHKELADLINKNIPGANAVATLATDPKLDSSVTVDGASILKVATWLRSNSDMPFNALQVISGVDYLERIEVCYMFAHFDVNAPREVILKVNVTDRVNGAVDSISKIYPAANWQERECYDMLGVKFNNHPDPRRILCPDDWQGFPLRRDYMTQKVYNGMIVNPDNKMNYEDREFVVRQDLIKKAQKAAATDA